MKLPVKLLLLACTFSTASALASDPFLEFDNEKYGVSVTRTRNVMDYAGVDALRQENHSTLRVLVTTESLTPDADTYALAEAFFDGIKRSYGMAEFKVFGRVDNKNLAGTIRSNYDYVFMVGTNQMSRDYERDETVYGSRTSDVRCSTSTSGKDVNCRETGSQSVPIGTRKTNDTVFTDIFFANYGTARQVTASWQGDSLVPGIAIDLPIGHVSVVMHYSLSGASGCENPSNAQITLARMAGASTVSSRPDKVSFKAAPDDIGCD